MSDLLSAMPTATLAWAAEAPPRAASARTMRVRTVRVRRMRGARLAALAAVPSALGRAGGACGLALEHLERRARLAVGADEARVPRRAAADAGVPVVEVDALDARADLDQLVEDEARDLRGARRPGREHELGLVGTAHDAAGLGEPEVAADRCQQLLGGLGRERVGVD